MKNTKKLLDLINIDVLNRLHSIIFETEDELNNLLSVFKEKLYLNKKTRSSLFRTKNLEEQDIKKFFKKLYSFQYSYEKLILEISEMINKYKIDVDVLTVRLIKESLYPGFIAEVFNTLFDLDYKIKINKINKENINSVNYSKIDEELLHPGVEKMLKETKKFNDYIKLFADSDISLNKVGDILFSNAMNTKNLSEPEKYVCYLLSKRFGTQYEITRFRK